MKKKQELEQLQLQMQNLLKNIKAQEEHIALLETLPTIKEYNAYLYDREKLQEEYEQKKEEFKIAFQENCSHPLHYFITDETGGIDFKNGYVNVYRKCLRCEYEAKEGEWFEISDWKKEMNNQIGRGTNWDISNLDYCGCKQVDIPFDVIHKEFLALESEGYSFEEIREILYSKYTEKNEELARNLKMKYMPKQGK